MAGTPPKEKPNPIPESPATAKPVDFEDEPQEPGLIRSESNNTNVMSQPPKPSVSSKEEDAPPSKPPRPLSPQAQAENTLIEAFPSIDAKVVKAVLTASGGQVEPAFNALLGMSDPDFEPEAPPARPPRPTAAQRQLEQDELYARQLAQHYSGSQRTQQEPGNPPLPRRRPEQVESYNDERDRSFFDDDLPVIRENVRKGFVETQTKVNRWISDFRKRIEGDDEDPLNGPPRMEEPPRRQNYGPSQSEQLYGIRRSADRSRRSGDAERYDADPHVLGDDFTALELRDEEGDLYQSPPGRPLANVNQLKSSAAPPNSGPVDEVDAIDRNLAQSGTPSGKAKWQPLTSVAPNPEVEDNDPFSLGDSDEEKESKTKDLREADSLRLKEAARNSVGAGETDQKPKTLEEHERGSISTKDKDAEAILTGKSS